MGKLQAELKSLFEIVDRLEKDYAKYKRKFTIDGHLIGSIGEVLTAEAFNLKLESTGKAVYDATLIENPDETVQIKATQINRVSFSPVPDNQKVPDYVIVIHIDKSAKCQPIYYGPGKIVYDLLAQRTPQKNGQIQLTIPTLKNLMDQVPIEKRLKYTSQQLD